MVFFLENCDRMMWSNVSVKWTKPTHVRDNQELCTALTMLDSHRDQNSHNVTVSNNKQGSTNWKKTLGQKTVVRWQPWKRLWFFLTNLCQLFNFDDDVRVFTSCFNFAVGSSLLGGEEDRNLLLCQTIFIIIIINITIIILSIIKEDCNLMFSPTTLSQWAPSQHLCQH